MRVSSMQPDTASVGPQARAARVKRMLLGILFVPEISLDGLGLLADRLRHHQVLPKPSDWGVKSLVLTQFFRCKYNSVDFTLVKVGLPRRKYIALKSLLPP